MYLPRRMQNNNIIDVGVESNNSWFLFIPTFPISNNKKEEGEARNEASKDHKHLLFSWPHTL